MGQKVKIKANNDAVMNSWKRLLEPENDLPFSPLEEQELSDEIEDVNLLE
jgi:hypothetical protein